MDNQPAFACAAENGHQPGMTLRQYHASACAAAIVSTIRIGDDYARYQRLAYDAGDPTVAAWIAREAFKLADALIAFEINEAKVAALEAERKRGECDGSGKMPDGSTCPSCYACIPF